MKKIRSALARFCMQLLCLLLGILLMSMLCFTVYVQYHIDHFNHPEPASQSQSSPSALPLSGSTEKTDAPLVNILLIGQDAREGEVGSRSDSIILCTYNPQKNTVHFTSFLRDLYVPIPGNGSNRINAAYAFGGSELLRKTLEENFRLKIDGTVQVDFSQFSAIVDMLGGVSVTLRADEAAVICEETGIDTAEGPQKLNGQQALAYSRIRKLDMDGDFSRTNRQRTVMLAILEDCRSAGTGTILKLVYNLLPMIDTDMEAGKIMALAVSAVPNLACLEFVSQYVPAVGDYQDQYIDGMSVLVPDLKKCVEHLHASFG